MAGKTCIDLLLEKKQLASNRYGVISDDKKVAKLAIKAADKPTETKAPATPPPPKKHPGCDKCKPTGKNGQVYEKFICVFYMNGGCTKSAGDCRGLHVPYGSACKCGRRYNIRDMKTSRALCMKCRRIAPNGTIRVELRCAFVGTKEGCKNGSNCPFSHETGCNGEGGCKRSFDVANKPDAATPRKGGLGGNNQRLVKDSVKALSMMARQPTEWPEVSKVN